MTGPGRRRRRWPLVALTLALIAAPAPWGPVALAAVLAVRGGIGARRRLEARRRARATLPSTNVVRLGRDGGGRPIGLSEAQLGAHALIVGATGAGKSTTLQTILTDRIAQGAPVVAIDMKGSPAFARALTRAAHDAGRPVRIWTPDGPAHWNPLAHGGPTALKDRLIAAERFSEPHYQRAAERYLQSALQVLAAVAPGRPPTLSEVVEATEPARLAGLAARVPGPLGERVGAYLETLTRDQLSAIRGIGTRLALLSESDAGRWLEPGPGPMLDLGGALEGGAVALISINSAVYGSLAAQIGTLAVQDLTSAAGRRLATGRVGATAVVALDEFSALGSDHVLSLLARGREAGVGVLLATQELSDLERAGRGFRDQVLGITAVTVAHRQEVHESALTISRMAGTRVVWRETQTLPARGGLLGSRRAPASRGSRAPEEVPVVHPNVIKRLATGEAVVLSGVPRPSVARVQIRAPSSASRSGAEREPGVAGTRSRRRGIRSAGRDQPPAPGVTR